jgi:hypothetical protein
MPVSDVVPLFALSNPKEIGLTGTEVSSDRVSAVGKALPDLPVEY